MAKKCIAMLLAGGQGSRLGILTKSMAKPAVSFGGKYRIIDFALSNCINSGIDTVGVLTQYRPLVLNHYIGTGEAWDLDKESGGVSILPPYATETGGSWYDGTADAVFHNIDFIDSYEPEHVLILSGDHLYKMNYNKMLAAHVENDADLTVSVIEVPWEEASRFGIMTTDETGRINRFSEKPKNPDSNLASMGIYIFKWEVLKNALIKDHSNPESEKDFGKNIIPMLLDNGKRLFSYRFKGYWKDVGTVSSYYDAQMDLISPEESGFDIFDPTWRIYSNDNLCPPHYMGENAYVSDCLISNGCIIDGNAIHSIAGTGAVIAEDATIQDSILLPNVKIGKGATLIRTVVNEGVRIKAGVTIGSRDGDVVLIGADSEFAE